MVTISQRSGGVLPGFKLRPIQIIVTVIAFIGIWIFHIVHQLGEGEDFNGSLLNRESPKSSAQARRDVLLQASDAQIQFAPDLEADTPSHSHDAKAEPHERTPDARFSNQLSSIKKSVEKDGEFDVPTIGYFISVTGCESSSLAEGAAVVKHSIHMTSIHGNLGGKYDYRMHAIYHPVASECAKELAELGYQLEERDTPVRVEGIRGEFLRRKIVDNGCCGEKELIKLEAYTFTQYPVVVHLDLDTMILKPMDPLFDVMLGKQDAQTSTIEVMWPDKPIPSKVNAFFTRDYGMVNPGRKYKPVQGGFLVFRPDQTVYNEYVDILKEGDFQEGQGWGGKRVGPFYGSLTIQGILPYYYDILHPGESVDLNRCVFDQMCDNPRDQKTVNDIVQGNCRTGEQDCEDCRSRPLEDIVSVHFTLCQKPWNCLQHYQDIIQQRLCRKLTHEWYRIRSDLEKSWGRSGRGSGDWRDADHFFGYCTSPGKRGYVPIAKPYGKAV